LLLGEMFGWIDIGDTFHMKFWRDIFEELNENLEGEINFANGSSVTYLKPTRIGTIMLKFPRFPDFLLYDVLYLHEFKRNLLSLVHI